MLAKRTLVLGAALLVGGALLVPAGPAAAAPLARPADPVVLTGADLPQLVNGSKVDLVGFRWSGSAWVQLPIQIDERAVVNFGKIYNNPAAVFYGSQPGLVNQLVYTSGNTWTGNDPNRKFDSDDELAFMARDAGTLAPSGSQPAGTKLGTGVRIKISDPLDPAAEGYVYLYRKVSGSGLAQGARVKYLTYRFKLKSGGYKTTYKLTSGPNPEDSLVTAGTYQHHFSDRWASDGLFVTAPGASGVDILDRHKALFSPGFCGRSEDTFDMPIAGTVEGAFVTSKKGPVRVIRSYIGANSGPNTQRTHIFYDRREDIVTDLRVHAIPSIMDFMDYSPAASGMTYRNELNPSGVTVDGSPDSQTAGVSSWEQITGPQGTINQAAVVQTSWTPASVTSYYLDSTTPTDTQCTGDGFAFGSSGLYINSNLPNTDPGTGGTATLRGLRAMYFESPGGTAADAIVRRNQVVFPLTASAVTAP